MMGRCEMTPQTHTLARMANHTKMRRLGQRLLELRRLKGWTQEQATQALDLDSPQTLSRYENGSRQPSKRRIEAIASVYGVNAGWLLYGESSADAFPDFDTRREAQS